MLFGAAGLRWFIDFGGQIRLIARSIDRGRSSLGPRRNDLVASGWLAQQEKAEVTSATRLVSGLDRKIGTYEDPNVSVVYT
jgi:hypothetical protein